MDLLLKQPWISRRNRTPRKRNAKKSRELDKEKIVEKDV